ncbi:hypothetical protein V7O66_10140 [Methanolobus sp. ZRKC3]|uniref:hypothetical protein n=1 Tax=Methanolobus sp. ZRKC3 TaxID=3125786 RepID=UPI00324DFCBA
MHQRCIAAPCNSKIRIIVLISFAREAYLFKKQDLQYGKAVDLKKRMFSIPKRDAG